MKKLSVIALGSAALLSLTACDLFSGDTTAPREDTSDEISSQDVVDETKNVLYRGIVQDAGVSIFMQGTHRLQLDDGRFILLESDDVNLDHYMDEEVEVYGAVRPTVEEGGMIMRVESIVSLEPVSSAMTSASSDSSSIDSSSSDSSSSSRASTAAQSVSSAPTTTSISSAAVAVSSASSVAWEASGELTAKAEVMAKDNLAESNWTQRYCSTHIKFCVPVHKNWWFKSFGTTSSYLWHVEIGTSEMNNLGEGPISINLVSGSVESAGATDGQVVVAGGSAVGYRAWDSNRHLEVRGPAILEQAIRYLTTKIEQMAG